jgi:CRISPR-associated endonuclease/helicase Cas3
MPASRSSASAAVSTRKSSCCASWHALRQRTVVQLPGGIEELVQEVYGKEAPPLPQPLQMLAERLQNDAKVRHQKHESQALTNAIYGPDDEDPFKIDRNLPDEEPATDVQGTPSTRLAEPNITLICAHQRGTDIVLSPDDARPLNLSARPDRDEEARLLRRSVRVQNRYWVEHFRNAPVPQGWQGSSALCHHRLAVFTNGELTAGGRVLRLDREVGLVTSTDVLCELIQKGCEMG